MKVVRHSYVVLDIKALKQLRVHNVKAYLNLPKEAEVERISKHSILVITQTVHDI